MDKSAKRFSIQWFIDSTSNWTRNLCNVPDIDIGKLKYYLIDSRQKTFDKDSVRAYKSLKAYKYFEEGFFQKLEHKIVEDEGQDLYLIHVEVFASYQGQVYQTYAAIDKQTVYPVGGACACVAGCGEACSHIAAILFAVEDFVAQGLNQLPDDKSCTDILCQWNKPSKRKVEMKKSTTSG
ncbi:uncharacterized protein LOC123544443 [Mercenaria mercenaria]|uniref:uncharacterized protein LOC123544443 n=1 Tax=Mercenaria mercenaria TaxID=6596 RepID=UPI00234EA5B0|nr:uncharacterized protein LOC123544443 [Mercenaria mercenaria]